MFSNHEIVPVIMFHSVGGINAGWAFSHIVEPIELFEEKIIALTRCGYNFLSLEELYGHMSGVKKVPKKSILLTFDDGYLDNWVYAFPILEKYGIKATIFVTPDFVDPTTEPRPTSKDGSGRRSDSDTAGFLNWQEMRLMERSGLIDIQSHALTHTWYFSGPSLLDFHRPGSNRYPWMAWNACPERKPFYISEDQGRLVPWGVPIYEHEKSLVCRRFFPPGGIAEQMASEVEKSGAENFFRKEGWKEELFLIHQDIFMKRKTEARYESDKEYRQRIFHELHDSKVIIENELNKRVDFICWPGGGYNETVINLAKEAGYRAWTLSSGDKGDFCNRPGADPCWIKRVSSFSRYPGNDEYGSDFAGVGYFLCGIERHKGSWAHKWYGRLLRLFGK